MDQGWVLPASERGSWYLWVHPTSTKHITSKEDPFLVKSNNPQLMVTMLIMPEWILYREWEEANGGGLKKCLQLVSVVLKLLHNNCTAGHSGIHKTFIKIQQRFYWVAQWVMTMLWHKTYVPLGNLSKHPKAPLYGGNFYQSKSFWMCQNGHSKIQLTTLRGNRYVLIIADYFTK